MSDYIDRKKLIDALNEIALNQYNALVNQVIMELPAVDVKVVRCKDCLFWSKLDNSAQGRCALGGFYPTGNWFCANGIKKI